MGGWRRGIRATWLLVLTGCSTAAGPSPADRSSTGLPDPEIRREVEERLARALDRWTEHRFHRGVSAAVVFPDGSEWVAAAGVEAQGSELRPGHLMWIASITKTMTGAVILQLASEGALSLDDPISRWLGPRRHVDPEITIQQLLNHTNGLANYTASPEVGAAVAADPSRVFTADELLGMVGPPSFGRGVRTQYTNTSFVLLGRIAEEATGRPITELWSERLFEPLDLDEIFLPGVQAPAGPVATAWTGRGVVEQVEPLERMSLLSLGNSAFGLFSNARTVARWGRALFHGPVLSPDMRAAMVEMVPAAGNIPGESGAGLGIRGYGYLGREQWGHSGGSPLGSSLLLFDPGSGVTVAVVMNQGPAAGHFDLAPELLEIAAGG